MPKQTQQEIEDRLLLENSIERVINTSTKLIEHHVPISNEDMEMNLLDWSDLKSLVVKLWDNARNEAFKRGQK